MKLLTKENLKNLPALGANEDKENPLAVVKFFTPWTGWTWYASEYNPETGEFFGLVHGVEKEYGYFTLQELESLRGPLGLKVERDRWFTPTPLKELE